jgi:ATP-dependent DNA ligase
MEAFAKLLDSLSTCGSTLAKRRLMADYFKAREDPERGWALAALAGTLSFPTAKPNVIRELVTSRIDPVLYALSRDYVGDMAETVALIWPNERRCDEHLSLSQIIDTLSQSDRKALRAHLGEWLDQLDQFGRWALLKLITGNIRIGVSARLAKTALADAFGKELDQIEQLWHGLAPPYESLFAWLEGKADKPVPAGCAPFLPMMLSHPIEDSELEAIDLFEFQVEPKWDGVRVQLARAGEQVALYSRTGDDISETFPDIVKAALAIDEQEFVLDGELLTKDQDEIAPFNALQQRLNRKNVTQAMLSDYPAHIRLYDILIDRGQDIRDLPLRERRARLENWYARHPSRSMDLSAVLSLRSKGDLYAFRDGARANPQSGVEGVMIKRLESPYIAGRPRGHWFKWKRNTLTLDCVLLYAQRGSGKRSSFYSDYTFGVWHEKKLLPIGKAYSGFTDEELLRLDKWIRANTINRFGPVREVKHELVFEIEFDSIHESSRHKSGLAMRFPRVQRIRWDKPAKEADSLENARVLAT